THLPFSPCHNGRPPRPPEAFVQLLAAFQQYVDRTEAKNLRSGEARGSRPVLSTHTPAQKSRVRRQNRFGRHRHELPLELLANARSSLARRTARLLLPPGRTRPMP